MKLIKCPYCGSDFIIESIYLLDRADIINGCVKCNCNRYPIINGILNIRVDLLRNSTIKLIEQGQESKATARLLLISPVFFAILGYLDKIIPCGKIISKFILYIIQSLANHNLTEYEDTSRTFYSIQRDSFLKHRFSVQSIWTVYPFFTLIKRKGGKILNLGCGNGHLAFMISKCANQKEQICIDKDFNSLYLARKYFVPDATFICSDANYSLPFKDQIFSSIICSDAFPFIDSKAFVACELKRVLKSSGFILVSHLRNSQFFDSSINSDILALPPNTWRSFFGNYPKIKIVPEQKIIDDFFTNTLDLRSEFPESVLASYDPINIISCDDDSFFAIYQNINNGFLNNKDNLIINPIYSVEFKGDEAILSKHYISEYFSKLYPLTESKLPSRYIIDAKILVPRTRRVIMEKNMSEGKINYINDLMMKLIIINVPMKYISDRDLG